METPDFGNPISLPTGAMNQADIMAGLKEALTKGIESAVTSASAENGFLNNPELKIPIPPEAEDVEKKARQLGLDDQMDSFIETMNDAASKAAAKATPQFLQAIRNLSIEDAAALLQSSNTHAATDYLETKTRDPLYQAFRPDVEAAIEEVALTAQWEPIATKYNKLPFVTKVNPDLNDYVTQKTLDGLFLLVGQEEEKIREDPLARTSDLLKRVFGNL